MNIAVNIDFADGHPARLREEWTRTSAQLLEELPRVEVDVSSDLSAPHSKGEGSNYVELAIQVVPVAAVIEGVIRVLVARIRAGGAQELTLTQGTTSIHISGPLDAQREAAVKEFIGKLVSGGE